MKHASRVYTEDGKVVAVASITQLGEGVLNVAVTTDHGSRMEPAPWTWEKAADTADEWVTALRGAETALPSRWLEGTIEP